MDLDQLRTSVERLIEHPLSALLGGSFPPGSLADQIVEEVADSLRVDESGKSFAPDQFTLSLHPSDVEKLKDRSARFQRDLSRGLNQSLRQAGTSLVHEAHITLATDPTLTRGHARVIAWHSSDPLHLSSSVAAQGEERAASNEEIPRGAFLVVAGKQQFRLEEKIVNIGRLPDNQLVLKDDHVSRRHAQARAAKGSFLIKDLESTSGTFVNGKRVREHHLRPGDVILLGETELIYGEDPTGLPGLSPAGPAPEGHALQDEEVTPIDLKQPDTAKLPRKDAP